MKNSRQLNDNEEIETITTKKVIKKSKRVNNTNPSLMRDSQMRQSKWEGDSFEGDDERKKNKILNMIKNAHIEKIKNGVLLREINNAHDEIVRFKLEGDFASAKMMENTLNDLHASVVLSNINPITNSKLWKSAYYNNPYSSFNGSQWNNTKTMYKTINLNEQNLYDFSKTTKSKKAKNNLRKTQNIEEEDYHDEEEVEETQIKKSKKGGNKKSKNENSNKANNDNYYNQENNTGYNNKENIYDNNTGYNDKGNIYDNNTGYSNNGNNSDMNRMNNDGDKKVIENLRNNPNSNMVEKDNKMISGSKRMNKYEIGHNNEINVKEININEDEYDTTKKKIKKKKKKKNTKKDIEQDDNVALDGRPNQYDNEDYEYQGEEGEEEEDDLDEVKPEGKRMISFSQKDSEDTIYQVRDNTNPHKKINPNDPNYSVQNPIISKSPKYPDQDNNPSLDSNKLDNPNKSQAEGPEKRLNPNPESISDPEHQNPQYSNPQYPNSQHPNSQNPNSQYPNSQHPNPQYQNPNSQYPNDLRENLDKDPSIPNNPKKNPNNVKSKPNIRRNPKNPIHYHNPLYRSPQNPEERELGIEPRVRPSSERRPIPQNPYSTLSEYPQRPILNFGKPLTFTRLKKKIRGKSAAYIIYGNDRIGKCFACDANCGISISGNSPSNYNPYMASFRTPRREKNFYFTDYYQYKTKKY